MERGREKIVRLCPRCNQPYSYIQKDKKSGHVYFYAVHITKDGNKRHIHKCYLGAEDYVHVKMMHPEMFTRMSGMFDNSRYIRYLEDIIGMLEKIKLDDAQRKEVIRMLEEGKNKVEEKVEEKAEQKVEQMVEEKVEEKAEQKVEQMVEEKVEEKPKRMHKIIVTIDEETWEKLWNLVKKKYTSTWRAYGAEVRRAIKEYLARQEATQ